MKLTVFYNLPATNIILKALLSNRKENMGAFSSEVYGKRAEFSKD
jgi:hypothetical protein